jgi:hypothetical protein
MFEAIGLAEFGVLALHRNLLSQHAQKDRLDGKQLLAPERIVEGQFRGQMEASI